MKEISDILNVKFDTQRNEKYKPLLIYFVNILPFSFTGYTNGFIYIIFTDNGNAIVFNLKID